ncbi:hypothetical protein [Corynebacterium uterequi]|uniref:Ferredoxin-like protein n=1 Tax=Corynebacterium uterequi TaxID=1072256 RepID=A0A0G3HJ41_9CORY|nr:hypothetical protein [Corynebacterium uterequi]AKK11973.1 hypothetical protein CUTER_10025 [Corynebacterium uterequi]
MAFRRPPNPNRNHPLFCPYCAGESLFPDEQDDFAWSCQECLRVFSVQFHGQDDAAERVPEPAPSTQQALRASLARLALRAGSVDVSQTGTPNSRRPEGV